MGRPASGSRDLPAPVSRWSPHPALFGTGCLRNRY